MRQARLTWTLATVAALVGAMLLTVALFDWNWVRDPVARYLSHKFDRPFAINGTLKGEKSLRPLLTGTDVTLGNVAGAAEPVLARAKQVSVRVDLLSLFSDAVRLPELTLTDTGWLLERDADGRANWDFGDKSNALQIGRLNVEGGTVRYVDRQRGVDFNAQVDSAASGPDGQLSIGFKGDGKWDGSDLALSGSAITPFAADVANRPYKLDVTARSGATNGTFKGTYIPARDNEIDGALALQGRDLSLLNAFLPLEFSKTPPYKLQANLKHGKAGWTLDEFTARIGETDLAGSVTIDRHRPRTLVTANFTSQTTHYKDLGSLVGLTGAEVVRAKAPAKPSATTPTAVQQHAGGSGDLSRLNLLDAKVHVKSKRFIVPDLRFDNLDASFTLTNGVLKMQPVEFVLAGGRAKASLTMDAREKPVQSVADFKVRDVELNDLVSALKPPKGTAGKASGRGHFTARGNTVREMLASTEGEIALVSAGGTTSSISGGLARLDLSRVGKHLFKRSADSSVQCAATDMLLDDGVLNVKTLVIETDEQTIAGRGKIDLARKRYDLDLATQTKQPSLFSFSGPVRIDGPFSNPNVHVDSGPLLARVGASVGLGLVNPIAALLPLLDIGSDASATDVNCRAMLEKTKSKIGDMKAEAKSRREAERAGHPEK